MRKMKLYLLIVLIVAISSGSVAMINIVMFS